MDSIDLLPGHKLRMTELFRRIENVSLAFLKLRLEWFILQLSLQLNKSFQLVGLSKIERLENYW